MSDTVEIAVSHQGGNWSRALSGAENLVEAAASAAWRAGSGPETAPGGAEISIALADDSLVRTLNREYRGKDEPTNVLSFPADDPGAPDRARMIGDVVLALETVEREAREAGKSVAAHVSHLVVHGVLHLAGYDHQTDADAKAMESLETAILAEMGIADPYVHVEQPVG